MYTIHREANAALSGRRFVVRPCTRAPAKRTQPFPISSGEQFGSDIFGSLTARKTAMQAVVGIWKDRTDIGSTEAYVRGLRRGTRLKRLPTHDR